MARFACLALVAAASLVAAGCRDDCADLAPQAEIAYTLKGVSGDVETFKMVVDDGVATGLTRKLSTQEAGLDGAGTFGRFVLSLANLAGHELTVSLTAL
ncbi:MAG: hypothetical protein CSB49_06785, partial [Proteobacteria bacterium]